MNLKTRLAIMNFIEFAVWGAYLTCMGNYLGIAGLGDNGFMPYRVSCRFSCLPSWELSRTNMFSLSAF